MDTLEREGIEERPLFPERGNPPGASPSGNPAPGQPADLSRDPVVSHLASIEQHLRDLRSFEELQTRELQHEQYSLVRILAGILQGIAVIVFGWCVVEFAFLTSQTYGYIAIRAMFALILQIMVLTALLWERHK